VNIIENSTELCAALAPIRGSGRIALVPTMGCLHEGHASLIREARKLADQIVVSIYVNPLQFGANEDLDLYPRTLAEDKAICEKEDADILFHPVNLYPMNGPHVTLKVEGLSGIMCGRSRPGHFDGVVTVVNILLNIVQPDIALFGEKDWQQLIIIRQMVNDLHLPVEVVNCETVREADGLAMSSRNRYLSASERKKAAVLCRALSSIQAGARAGEARTSQLLKAGNGILTSAGIKPEYLEIRQADTLNRLDRLNGTTSARAFIAARIGSARLIDNIALETP